MVGYLAVLVTAVCLLVGGCSGGGGGNGENPAAGGDSQPPFGLTMRTIVNPDAFPLVPGNPDAAAVLLTDAFPGLTFNAPLFFTALPGSDDQVIVVEQEGKIHLFANDPAADVTTLMLDIGSKVLFAGEQGLLGLAFDPQFVLNRHFYVYYSADSPRRSVISRFTFDPVQNRTDPSTEKILLEFEQPFPNHNGGMLAFGPDGYLYVASGDGGSGGDPLNNAQNPSNLLGKILRLDPRRGDPYAIPLDNPFVGLGGGLREEIYALGLRNPFRFSFDRQTGTLWAGDVGQNTREEVDIIERGGNYGWRVFEGNLGFNGNDNDLPPSAFTPPIIDYDRSQGDASVTGGYVYRGNQLPELWGAYIYGDFISGRIWALVVDADRQVASNTQIETSQLITSFGEDQQAELYVVSRTGKVFRLENSVIGNQPVPPRLSETGIFRDLESLEANEGFIEYDIQVPYWSDGTRKRRWLVIPGELQIDFDPTDAWQFPVGTLIIQHFEILEDEADPFNFRKLETRVLVHEQSGWTGYTYKWNQAQTDADLLAGAQFDTLSIATLEGSRQQLYYYPGRSECLQCHNAAAGTVLGVRTRQMNRDFDYDGVVDNQLRAFNHIALLAQDIGDPADYDLYPDIADEAVSLEPRARTYLAVNCGQCHRPGGPTGAAMDLRFDTPLPDTGLIDIFPDAGDLGIDGARLVKPGVKEKSLIWERMRRLDNHRMPPLASHRVDQTGLDLIGTWIDSLGD